MSRYFMVTGVLAGLLGMGLGIRMGAVHDFTLAPAHAHLNLVGFVTLFLAGLFYAVRPEAAGRVAVLHYLASTVGAIILVTGIAGSVTARDWGVPVAIAGSFVTVFGMLLFALQVVRYGAAAPRAETTQAESWPAALLSPGKR
jgi:mannose/fructose/N-acetylgalactosamine-specific phosphotransferase system component IIC